MANLATLIARRDALEAARFKGVRTVEYDGRSVTYRSDTEIRTALADLNRQIAALQGGGPLREVRINSSKGI